MQNRLFAILLIIVHLMGPSVGMAEAQNIGAIITDLGTLGGGTSYPWDLNDYGHVVGESDTHPFL